MILYWKLIGAPLKTNSHYWPQIWFKNSFENFELCSARTTKQVESGGEWRKAGAISQTHASLLFIPLMGSAIHAVYGVVYQFLEEYRKYSKIQYQEEGTDTRTGRERQWEHRLANDPIILTPIRVQTLQTRQSNRSREEERLRNSCYIWHSEQLNSKTIEHFWLSFWWFA